MSVDLGKKCTGCSACASSCPVGCICMATDEEGFAYPVVDTSVCVRCGACERVCPVINAERSEPLKAYAYVAFSPDVVGRAASGGAFTSLAALLLADGGIAVGVADDITSGSYFAFAEDEHALENLACSKYYQCNLTPDVIARVCSELSGGRRVLFCGTPCQVAAVKNCVPRHLSGGLLLVDIVCQGVPSRKAASAFRSEVEGTQGRKLVRHVFRSKSGGAFEDYVALLSFEDGTELVLKGDEDLYNRSFKYRVYLRESCYECPFATCSRSGDITLGDFWGYPFGGEFEAGRTSLVLVNNEKGARLIQPLSLLGRLKEADVDSAVAGNVPLRHPVARPRVRSVSYQLLERLGFARATCICCWKHAVKQFLRCGRRA